MRKQYHFWPGEHGLDAWDVDRLVDLTVDAPVEHVALSDIQEIDSVYWFDARNPPTVRNIAFHFALARDVDTSHPIILGPDGRVMDGMHRVVRALLEDWPTIAAVRLTTLPDPDYRNCRPEDLPYEQRERP